MPLVALALFLTAAGVSRDKSRTRQRPGQHGHCPLITMLSLSQASHIVDAAMGRARELELRPLTLVSLQIVLSRGEIDDWFNASNIQSLTWAGGIALILFIAWQFNSRNSAPLLRLELVRNRNMQASMALGLFAGVILAGSLYALPEFLRNVYPAQLSATQTGQIMCIYAVTAAAIRPLVSKAIARFGQRKAIVFAFAMLVASMFLFARLMTIGTPDIDYATPLILYAFCLAPMLSATSSGTVGKMPLSDQLDAVAIYMTVRQLGASLGVTMVTIVLDWRETLHSSRLFEHLQAGATQAQEWMNAAAQAVVERGGIRHSKPSTWRSGC